MFKMLYYLPRAHLPEAETLHKTWIHYIVRLAAQRLGEDWSELTTTTGAQTQHKDIYKSLQNMLEGKLKLRLAYIFEQ